MKIDITKYKGPQGPQRNAFGHTKMQQRKMAREWLTNKDTGNSKGAWKNFVKDRQDLKKIIDKVEKPKKVAEAKPNGKYEMPKSNFDSFDWDLWLREKDKNYMTLEDEKKIVSQPSVEASNAEWWENEFLDYKKDGGKLPFLQFKEMMINEADINMTKKIDKIIKKKLLVEGLNEDFTMQKLKEGKYL